MLMVLTLGAKSQRRPKGPTGGGGGEVGKLHASTPGRDLMPRPTLRGGMVPAPNWYVWFTFASPLPVLTSRRSTGNVSTESPRQRLEGVSINVSARAPVGG